MTITRISTEGAVNHETFGAVALTLCRLVQQT